MLKASEQAVHAVVEEFGMCEIDESIELIREYRKTDFYESKNALIAAWEIDHRSIYEFVISTFTAVLTTPNITYQALVGMLNHKIKLPIEIDRIRIAADLVGLISTTGLVDINSRPGEYHNLTTDYDMGIPLSEEDKHIPMLNRPQPIESNWDREGTGSVILGNKMNHHEGFVRLSHLQRMGQVKFSINEPFVNQYEEAGKHDPDTEEKWDAFEYFKECSQECYKQIIEEGNKYFIPHKYCTRGRSYSCSYYADPQGNSFKKAVVQLYNKEVVTGV